MVPRSIFKANFWRSMSLYSVILSGVLLGIGTAPSSFAQVATGIPPFSSVDAGPADVVNLGNLNVHIPIPIINKLGRGLPLAAEVNIESSIWIILGNQYSHQWWVGGGGAGQAVFGTALAKSVMQGSCTVGGQQYYYTYFTGWTFEEPSGTDHSFPGLTIQRPSTQCHVYPTNSNMTTSDGSGYHIQVTATADNVTATVWSRSGLTYSPRVVNGSGTSYALTDTNGNQITGSSAPLITTYTDTLNLNAFTITSDALTPTWIKYTYTTPSGGTTPITANLTSYTLQSNFQCSGITEFSQTRVLATSIVLPDQTSYQITYEPTPGGPSGAVTGRIASITLPTGGQISYQYTGSNDGVNCSDGSTMGLTRTTPDGIWTYARAAIPGTSQYTTTITGPAPDSNQTRVTFETQYEIKREVYQGSISPSNLLKTTYTCYNGATFPCNTYTPGNNPDANPIQRRTVYTVWPNGLQSKVDTYYDYNSTTRISLGLVKEVDEYGYGSGAPGSLVRKTVTTYNTSLTNGIYDRPAQVTVYDGSGSVKAQTTYTYDQGSTTASGAPQHVSISGSRGNPTTVAYSTGLGTLSRGYTYFDTGTVLVATDVNSGQTTYGYMCAFAFPSSITLPISGLSRSATWDCNGGVKTSQTDENGQTTYYYWNDQYYWRPTSTKDPTNAITNINYYTSPAFATESTLNFNGSVSTVDTRTTFDTLGRAHISQRRQSQGGSSYDSTETDYDSVGRAYRVSVPYSAGAGGLYGGSSYTITSFDALSRPTLVTDAGSGTVGYTYNQNDVLVTAGPAPSGENTKRRQLEYDALGRLTSVCEVTSATGSGTCSQTSAKTGFWTRYTYDVLDDLTGVTQNAQGSPTQSRSYVYDRMGRLTSETNPESGTTSYVYDTDSTCTPPHNGDKVKRVDAMGTPDVTCYGYDLLHRLTSITYPSGSYSGVTPSKTFVYDTATVNGVAMAFAKGRLAEAYTGSSKTTDLGYSYNARGDLTDVYESTPHSGGYYYVSAAYWENGVLKTLNPHLSGQPNWTYNPDGEGRVLSVTASTGQSPLVNNTSYNAYGEATGMTYGSADSDAFIYDDNTGRMSRYTFAVNGSSVVGNLTWNANGTLNQLAITDPFNSGNQQTCNYAHDDMARTASGNCTPKWNQSFSFDVFGNISKTGLGGGAESFLPTYGSTNRISSVGGQTYIYDANGNLTTAGAGIGSVAYTWDAEGRMLTDTPYGSPTISATYDALGRMVERGASGSYTQTIYTPTGVPMTMQGQSLAEAYVPLSGGAWAVYYSTVLNAYWHPDWQGNVRLQSSPTRTVLADIAYGPYGEMYVSSGVEPFYGGMFQRTSWEIYDATFRRYQFTQGRWISPDPAGLTAVDPNYPQSLNRYGYVMNSPTTLTDPLGLFCRKGEGCPTGNESDDDQDLASYERWYRRIKLVLIPPLPPLPPPPQPPQFLTELIVPVPCSDLFTLADQQNYNVTTQFNQIDPLHPEGHKGMDFSAPKGTSVNIQFEGDITFNGPASRFGNAVAVSKDFEVAPGISLGVTYVFGHGALEPGLAVGQQVSPGDQIMSVGSLGRSNGPHLHVQKSTNDRFKGPFQQPCTP